MRELESEVNFYSLISGLRNFWISLDADLCFFYLSIYFFTYIYFTYLFRDVVVLVFDISII